MLQTCLILLITGLLWGGVYLLMASGLNLIYGVMKVVNLAHGDFIVFGGLLAVSLFTFYKAGPLIALPVAAIVLFLIGVIVQRSLLTYLDGSGPQGELR